MRSSGVLAIDAMAPVSRNFQKVSCVLERINYPTVVGGILATWILAILESQHLALASAANPEAAFNTLRISNQLFSLLTVLAFAKFMLIKLEKQAGT